MGAQLNPLGLANRTTIYQSGSNGWNFSNSAQAVWTSNGSGTGILNTGGAFIINFEISAGGGFYSEVYSGIMQWYPYTTNGNDVDNIYLTAHGHARNASTCSARVRRRAGNAHAEIQMWTSANSGTGTVSVSVVRLSDR